ncbi:MAG: hypothetical protein KDC52_02365 [Ignavibacteriae bacterium]|nr:hypothetical protein [Ignavibacteriota bacterium]
MSTEKDLLEATKQFFELYWDINKFGNPPEWNEPWLYKGSIPDHDKKGCYALLSSKGNIEYIGVAIGKNFSKYKTMGAYFGGGLGARLKAYWKVDKSANQKGVYQPSTKWESLKSIRTIGFDEDYYHLAAALEVFLIDKLKPTRNFKHKSS